VRAGFYSAVALVEVFFLTGFFSTAFVAFTTPTAFTVSPAFRPNPALLANEDR
jgi:hypothetical protein